jgi:hypothetical protein
VGEATIIDAARTPLGKRGGGQADVTVAERLSNN